MTVDEFYIERIKEQNEEINRLRDEITTVRDVADRRIDALQTGKTSSKLFYVFVTTFSILYVAGIVTTYKKSVENTSIFQEGVLGLRVAQTELKAGLKYTAAKTDEVGLDVTKLQEKFEEEIRALRKQLREGKLGNR